MKKPEEEPLIKEVVARRLLGDISLRQLRRLLRDRDDEGRPQLPLPFHTVGSGRMYYVSEIKAWIRKDKKAVAEQSNQ